MPPIASSLRFSLPIRIAPASFSRATTVASVSGMLSAYALEPLLVSMPAVLNWSLTATGTPNNAPATLSSPRRSASSASDAAPNASSLHTVM